MGFLEDKTAIITGRNKQKLTDAKEGIRGLTRVAANEWGADGINANIICPLAWTARLENFKPSYPEAFEANVKMPWHPFISAIWKKCGDFLLIVSAFSYCICILFSMNSDELFFIVIIFNPLSISCVKC